MGMQASDPTVHNSSIALLQERFRQLQRAKEIREERELLKLLSETMRLNTPAYYYEPFLQGESCRQATQSQNSLKVQPCLVFMQKDAEAKEKPDLVNLLAKDLVMHKRIVFNDEHSDVDTSLHL